MTNMNKFFGNYLKSEDIKEEIELTVKAVAPEELGKDGDKERKLIVYFVEEEKGLVLNRTNADAIAKVVGSEEIEDWVGKKLMLFVDKDVVFMGEKVGGVRVRVPEEEPSEAAEEAK